MARPLLTHNLVALLVGIATAALLLGLALVQQQPGETRQAAAPQALVASPAAVRALSSEVKALSRALQQQHDEAAAQLEQLRWLAAAANRSSAGSSAAATASSAIGSAAASAAASAAREAAEAAALATCTEADVPILRLWRRPCPGGRAGFACDVQWDLQDRFLPEGSRWLFEWRGARRRSMKEQLMH